MEYKIEYDTIIEIVEEEVSREAAQAYTADGLSLYDGIRMISRDEALKYRIMSEVLVLIKAQCNRFLRHVELLWENEQPEPTSFVFELDITKRRETGKELSLMTLFRSMTVNFFLNRYFASKNLSDLAAKYDAKALADVEAMTTHLFTKLPPVYPTIK